jgi:hypothetical protein
MRFSIDRWQKLAGVSLLRESEEKEARLRASIEGYAVGKFDTHGDITIVLYDPEKMKAAVRGLGGAKSSVGEMPSAVVGMIRGAWEIVRSGTRMRNVGIGGLLYRLAGDASPTGRVMPDRRDVSPSAQKMWTSAFGRMSDEKKKETAFDDESNPQTPDPSDDCLINPSGDFLNHAYDDVGKGIDVDRLTAAHEAFMDEISWDLPVGVDIGKLFYKAASEAFHEMTD